MELKNLNTIIGCEMYYANRWSTILKLGRHAAPYPMVKAM